MDPLTENVIRASFINCSKGEATRMPVPRDLDGRPWQDLDFLGWTDARYPGRGQVVLPDIGGPVGIALRFEKGGSRRAQMCAICLTTHTAGGVQLMVAPRAGEAGRLGNTVGTYLCADFGCSLYARRLKTPVLGRQHREDFDPVRRVAQVRENLGAFVARVRG